MWSGVACITQPRQKQSTNILMLAPFGVVRISPWCIVLVCKDSCSPMQCLSSTCDSLVIGKSLKITLICITATYALQWLLTLKVYSNMCRTTVHTQTLEAANFELPTSTVVHRKYRALSYSIVHWKYSVAACIQVDWLQLIPVLLPFNDA